MDKKKIDKLTERILEIGISITKWQKDETLTNKDRDCLAQAKRYIVSAAREVDELLDTSR